MQQNVVCWELERYTGKNKLWDMVGSKELQVEVHRAHMERRKGQVGKQVEQWTSRENKRGRGKPLNLEDG